MASFLGSEVAISIVIVAMIVMLVVVHVHVSLSLAVGGVFGAILFGVCSHDDDYL